MVEVQNELNDLYSEVFEGLEQTPANAVDLSNANKIAHEAHIDSEVIKELKPMQECEDKVINVLDKVTKVFEKEIKLNNASRYRNQLQERKQKLTANTNEMHNALGHYDHFASTDMEIKGKAKDTLKKKLAEFQQFKNDAEGIESQLPVIEERIDDELIQQEDIQSRDQMITSKDNQLTDIKNQRDRVEEAEKPENVAKLKTEMEDKKTDVEGIKAKLEEYQKKVKKGTDLESDIIKNIQELNDCLDEINFLLEHLKGRRVSGDLILDTKTRIGEFEGFIERSKLLVNKLDEYSAMSNEKNDPKQNENPEVKSKRNRSNKDNNRKKSENNNNLNHAPKARTHSKPAPESEHSKGKKGIVEKTKEIGAGAAGVITGAVGGAVGGAVEKVSSIFHN